MYCDLRTIRTPSPLRHADVLNEWSHRANEIGSGLVTGCRLWSLDDPRQNTELHNVGWPKIKTNWKQNWCHYPLILAERKHSLRLMRTDWLLSMSKVGVWTLPSLLWQNIYRQTSRFWSYINSWKLSKLYFKHTDTLIRNFKKHASFPSATYIVNGLTAGRLTWQFRSRKTTGRVKYILGNINFSYLSAGFHSRFSILATETLI